MGEIAVAIIAGLVALAVALLGLYGAKRYNIGPNQEKLVMTLKDIVAAQNLRIDQVESENKELRMQLDAMQIQINKLTKLTITQALKISDLEGKTKGG